MPMPTGLCLIVLLRQYGTEVIFGATGVTFLVSSNKGSRDVLLLLLERGA